MSNEEGGGRFFQATRSHEQTVGMIEKLFEAARPAAVYSAPIKRGDTTIITASEIAVGLGVGYGSGGRTETGDHAAEEEGGGGGGGGGASGRPVAVIRIGADGHVEVKPVIDLTKLGIAAFTALGSMLLLRSRMRH